MERGPLPAEAVPRRGRILTITTGHLQRNLPAMSEHDLSPHRQREATRHCLAALHALALADGDFSPEEQRVLGGMLERDLPGLGWEDLHQPGDAALVQTFCSGSKAAGQFLRTAVVVALADGHISEAELTLLTHWAELLEVAQAEIASLSADPDCGEPCEEPHAGLDGIRRWLDGFEPEDPAVARFLVHLLPAQCPFERDIVLFGHKLVHIPPMCRVNPLYDQLMALRFRCLCTLESSEPHQETAS